MPTCLMEIVTGDECCHGPSVLRVATMMPIGVLGAVVLVCLAFGCCHRPSVLRVAT